jgi:hypothetical protein
MKVTKLFNCLFGHLVPFAAAVPPGYSSSFSCAPMKPSSFAVAASIELYVKMLFEAVLLHAGKVFFAEWPLQIPFKGEMLG